MSQAASSQGWGSLGGLLWDAGSDIVAGGIKAGKDKVTNEINKALGGDEPQAAKPAPVNTKEATTSTGKTTIAGYSLPVIAGIAVVGSVALGITLWVINKVL